MSAYVVVVRATGKAPQQLELEAPRLIIGREAGDIVLGDGMCSSTHGELTWNGTTLTFRDLGSTNGTWVNGERVTQLTLTPGVTLTIGKSSIEVVSVGAQGGRGRTVVAPAISRRTRTPTQAPVTQNEFEPGVSTTKPASSSRSTLVVIGVLTGLCLLGGAVGGAVVLINRNAAVKKGGTTPSSPSLSFGAGAESAKGGEVTVKFVWFSGTPGVKVSGGASDLSVRVSPNSKAGASVGVIEEFSGGTGNQWRTTAWLAAFNASRATNHSLVEHEYLVRAGGHVDGPSAGMLTTATMMALLRGKAPLPNTTMTGTINPDGSAGPVGGIVQKMEGAREQGIRRFGYPMGARNHMDMRDKSMVDLNDVGARLGIETREIHDLNEAYEFLTGDSIALPPAIDEGSLDLDPQANAKLRAKLTSWKARVDGDIARVKEDLRKNARFAQALNNELVDVEETINRGKRYERSDLAAPALNQFLHAAVSLVIIHDSLGFYERLSQGDFAALGALVDEATTTTGQVDAFREELLLRAQKNTVGGQVSAVLAFSAWVVASNFCDLGEEHKARARAALEALRTGKLQSGPEAMTYISTNLLMPIVYYHSAKVALEFARDYQDLLNDEGDASSANLARLGAEASAYGSAAGAALNYFDALITEQNGAEKGMTKEKAQNEMANRELPYLLAHRGVQLTEALKTGEGSRGLMRLAAGYSSYITAAGLVNKYYSLAAHMDHGKAIIDNRKSLTAQLEQARAHARQAASRAKSVAGFVPTAAKIEFQLATAEREGSDDDKLDALTAYWNSAFYSELAAKLATK